VVSFDAGTLVLEDARRVPLPYVREIPFKEPVFLAALKRGVEITPDGELIGLLRIADVCGNDPCIYRLLRVNLADLAGVLHPAGLDPARFDAETLRELAEDSKPRPLRVDGYLLLRMRRVRRSIDMANGVLAEGRDPVIGGRGEHDARTGFLIL
jgi:hypothetical protein